MRKKIVNDFRGDCEIKSNWKIGNLAELISAKLFGNAPFIYGEHSVWEEIPSMYIEDNIFGMFVIFGGYGGENGYTLRVQPYGDFGRYLYTNKIENEGVNLDLYLYHLLKQSLKDYSEIEIIEPKI
jgi:hypothetical protein